MTTATTEERPRYYYVDEVAAEIRRSEAAVRWLIHTKAIKSSLIGGRRVVTREHLDEFFASAGDQDR